MHRRQSILGKLAPFGSRVIGGVRPFVLDVAGLALLTSAAVVVALPLGLAVGGIACFVLQWRVTG